MSTLTVLQLINYAGKGGSEAYVRKLTERFISRGANVLFAYNEEGPLCQQMMTLGVDPVQIDMKSPLDIAAARKVAALCKANNVDIIHCHYARENYIALLSTLFYRKPKVVYTSHINLVNTRLWKTANQIMGRRNAAIIAVCREGQRLLVENGFPPDKITVIYNGVDEVKQNILENKADSPVRREFGIDKDTFLFVTLTRFTPEKGTGFLLSGVKALKDSIEPESSLRFKLLIAGDGPQLDTGKEFAKLHGLEDDVIFAGYRDDSGNILQAGDAFINSSSSEALSFAILEAMSAGLPVIATAVGGNTEVVTEETGILVPYGDTEALRQAMLTLLRDGAAVARYAANARRKIRERFNMDMTARLTMEVYEKALGTGIEEDTEDANK